jgi:hypothetical protein
MKILIKKTNWINLIKFVILIFIFTTINFLAFHHNNFQFDKIKEEEEKFDLNHFINNEFNINNKNLVNSNLLQTKTINDNIDSEINRNRGSNITTTASGSSSSITDLLTRNNPTSTITKSGIRREFIGRYLMEKMGWRGQGMYHIKNEIQDKYNYYLLI